MNQYSQPQPYYTGSATTYQTGNATADQRITSQGTQQPLIMAQPSTGGGAVAASKAANKATGYGGSEVGALIGTQPDMHQPKVEIVLFWRATRCGLAKNCSKKPKLTVKK